MSCSTHPEFEELSRFAPELERAARETDLHRIEIDIATLTGKRRQLGWMVNGTRGTFAIYSQPCDHPFNRTEWIITHRPTGMKVSRPPFTFTHDRDHAFRMAVAFHDWLRARGADLESNDGNYFEPFLAWSTAEEHDAFWRGIAAS